MNKPFEAKYLDVQTASVVTVSDKDYCNNDDLPSAKDVGKSSSRPESFNVECALVKGTIQEPAFRDKWFGIAFVVHIVIMIVVMVLYASEILETMEPNNDVDVDPTRRLYRMLNAITTNSSDPTLSYQDEESSSSVFNNDSQEEDEELSESTVIRLLSTFLLSFCMAPMLAVLAMKHMATHAVQLIQTSLYFAIALNVVIGAILSVYGSPIGVWNLVFAGILICYAWTVWHRIPFAAANLKAAVTCVQSNLGMVFLGLASIPIFTVWLFMWGYVFACVMNSPWMKSQEEEVEVTDDAVGYSNTHEAETLTPEGISAVMALLLSFYWTWHVVRNVVHTTLAGTVGTWWFLPQEANGCCSRGFRDSLRRSLTYSFGSICFGSLLVAIIEVLKSVLQSMANNRRGGIVRLIAQCLLGCLERLAEYFNKWAFVYVGLYGYSYIEAGKNVFQLFFQRGWSTIITDSLVNRMLGMMCVCIGLVNGLAAALFTLGSSGDVIGASSLFGFFTGLLMSSMTFGVLVSAVDSIIVLWAEAPADLKANQPALCQELEDAWMQAWPDVFSPGVVAVATPVV